MTTLLPTARPHLRWRRILIGAFAISLVFKGNGSRRGNEFRVGFHPHHTRPHPAPPARHRGVKHHPTRTAPHPADRTKPPTPHHPPPHPDGPTVLPGRV